MLARESKRRLSGIIALVAVTALLAPPAARLSAAGGEGAQEGIKVHGDWTIEIRDPDGTLVTRREFKNKLMDGVGPFSPRAVLAGLLKGSIGVKGWGVLLSGSPEPPCTAPDGSPTGCVIAEPNSSLTGPYVTTTLVVTLTNFETQLELSGNATAARASSINSVTTGPVLTTGQVPGFTQKVLSTPIAVAEGQIIQVKVVISFS